MKVTLVNSFFGGEVGEWHYPPLELGFLATYIKAKTDCEVKVIDPVAQNFTISQTLKEVKDSDIVGINCFTERRFQCFEFAKAVKKVNPDCLLIIGGPHATIFDTAILSYYQFIDVVVRGEGEETLLELVEGKPFKDILGITWRREGEVIRNPPRPLSVNIDNFYVDYSLLPPPDSYVKDYAAPHKFSKRRQLYILATRGCPYHCKFCGGFYIWRGCWRAPRPQVLVKRMEELVGQYNVEYFRFCDGNFTANERWVLKFCRELKRRKLKVFFGIDSRVNISKYLISELSKAGCIRITFGIESGSDRVLRNMNKYITRKTIIKAIRASKDAGIWTRGDFIISWPNETWQDFKRTLEIVKMLDEVEPHILHILPGTLLYEELKNRGEITDKVWFDRKYPSKIFYCKELFPSAKYSFKELAQLLEYMCNFHAIKNPYSQIEKKGLIRGILSVMYNFLSYGKRLKDYKHIMVRNWF